MFWFLGGVGVDDGERETDGAGLVVGAVVGEFEGRGVGRLVRRFF